MDTVLPIIYKKKSVDLYRIFLNVLSSEYKKVGICAEAVKFSIVQILNVQTDSLYGVAFTDVHYVTHPPPFFRTDKSNLSFPACTLLL